MRQKQCYVSETGQVSRRSRYGKINRADLDELLEKLESPDTTLEESFACYEAGMKLVKACNDKIDKVEKQMIILQGGAEEDGDA